MFKNNFLHEKGKNEKMNGKQNKTTTRHYSGYSSFIISKEEKMQTYIYMNVYKYKHI